MSESHPSLDLGDEKTSGLNIQQSREALIQKLMDAGAIPHPFELYSTVDLLDDLKVTELASLESRRGRSGHG